jgi:transcriptional regulator with XRE-family HTH domain
MQYSANMATKSAMVVSDELSTHRRARLARIAAEIDPETMAIALGMSKRSYERAEAGARRFSRAELVLLAQLTNQDPSFFGVTSAEPQEARTLPGPLPGVNRADEDRAA